MGREPPKNIPTFVEQENLGSRVLGNNITVLHSPTIARIGKSMLFVSMGE